MGDGCCGNDCGCGGDATQANCTCDGTCTCKKGGTCCSEDTTSAKGGCCSDTGTCGCAGQDGNPLELNAEQIKRINEILGDIDDEDLETGNYDLTEKQAEELNNILFKKE